MCATFLGKKTARDLSKHNIPTATVVGFPFGYQMTETKVQELELAMQNGATQFDLALNVSAYQSGMPWVKIEIAKFAHRVHAQNGLLSVHIDMNLLQPSGLGELIKICRDAGADFISLAYADQSFEAIAKDLQHLSREIPSDMGLKIRYGVVGNKQLEQLSELGVEAIGCDFSCSFIRNQLLT